MCGKLLSFFDKEGQVAKFAVFHNQVDMAGRFKAVMEGNDVWVA
jgi:hypothetical protein